LNSTENGTYDAVTHYTALTHPEIERYKLEGCLERALTLRHHASISEIFAEFIASRRIGY
jgi:hypothetical protein